MIYFIKGGKFTKIGYTGSDVEGRIASLQTGCPYNIELLGVIDGDVELERSLHKQLEKYRVRGEWFDLPDSVEVSLQYKRKPSIIQMKKESLPITMVLSNCAYCLLTHIRGAMKKSFTFNDAFVNSFNNELNEAGVAMFKKNTIAHAMSELKKKGLLLSDKMRVYKLNSKYFVID